MHAMDVGRFSMMHVPCSMSDVYEIPSTSQTNIVSSGNAIGAFIWSCHFDTRATLEHQTRDKTENHKTRREHLETYRMPNYTRTANRYISNCVVDLTMPGCQKCFVFHFSSIDSCDPTCAVPCCVDGCAIQFVYAVVTYCFLFVSITMGGRAFYIYFCH